jgi:hypothetical protein
MGISQQIGASSLIKAGVIENTANRPASPYEGQVIFQKDTDQLLVWNGTAWVIPNSPAQNPSGLEYITGGSFSAVTEILVDSVFTSTYRNYRIVFDALSSAGAGLFTFQVRAAGSTILANYNYSALDINGGSLSGRVAAASTIIRFGANDANGWNAATLDILTPQIAQPTRLICAFNRNSATIVENVWGANTNSTSYDGFRIHVNSGTMTGSYTLYGYRN